ncbi:hypothetical protein BH11GEM1_BH11GEM1_00070 [soil metagenome]
MSDLSRREWIRTVSAAGAAAALPVDLVAQSAAVHASSPVTTSGNVGSLAVDGDVSGLSSTSEVFVPPRGRAFMKFSFDFPEPSVAFGDYRFGFLVFTAENTYGLDRSRLKADVTAGGMTLTCDRFVWAGGQETAPGSLVAHFRRVDGAIEWDAVVTMERPVKTISTLVRAIPRGTLSFGNGGFFDPHDNEILAGYPFGAGDLHGPGEAQGMSTPLAVVQAGAGHFVYLSSRDTRVRPKRFYFQPGEHAYKVEAIHEHDGWRNDTRVELPTWRLGSTPSMDAAVTSHFAHVEKAYNIPSWEARTDVPDWFRRTALVTTLHGMHYTGYMFNDYAKMLETLRWMNTQIPGERVLVFVSAWDGRYYWDYPNFSASDRMGGEEGFRRLVREGQRMGFRMMPMFGMNSANRKQPVFASVADAVTAKIDGDVYNLNWVDWNNDRHQDGWLAYIYLGIESWRQHIEGRIADAIDRYGVDAYFLDIAGGHVNDTKADMHEGTRRLVTSLRARFPKVLCVGEMPYDALHEFIPVYHAGGGGLVRPGVFRYSRFFQHLSLPAPGRGSTGVHEAGFGTFDEKTLMLRADAIPTLNVVDDTCTQHRDVMAAVIQKARERAGI